MATLRGGRGAPAREPRPRPSGKATRSSSASGFCVGQWSHSDDAVVLPHVVCAVALLQIALRAVGAALAFGPLVRLSDSAGALSSGQ